LRTLGEWLRVGAERLRLGPHPERARQDAEVLLRSVLNQDRAWILAHSDEPVNADAEASYTAMLSRRLHGEPIQYIAGQCEFFGMPFAVAPGVLIPRPETEHLVEEVLRLATLHSASHIADIGTGSGAIAVALAHRLPTAQIVATDISSQALAIARDNANRNSVSDRIDFREGDLLAPLAGQSFDILASNPPYVPLRDRVSLSVEVRGYEPESALFAGDDGLAIYRRLIPDARTYLKQDGWLVVEIGCGQQQAIEQLFEDSGYREVHFIADYQGIPRVAIGQRS
jgi:release factor glutamine methyltransferase